MLDEEIYKVLDLFDETNEEATLKMCASELIKIAVRRVDLSEEPVVNVGNVRNYLDGLLQYEESSSSTHKLRGRLRLLKKIIEYTHAYAKNHPDEIQ